MNEVEARLLPRDEGGEPWMREVVGVPVLLDGDERRVVGTADVAPDDDGLVATITVTDESVYEWLSRGRFGLHGRFTRGDDGAIERADLQAISVTAP